MKPTCLIIVILLSIPAITLAQITWTEHYLDNNFNGARGVTAADLDGDGDLDVIGCASDANQLAWWENLGESEFSGRQIINAAAYDVQNAQGVDLDGDGDTDVVAALHDTDDIVWYENNGSQEFTMHQIDSNSIGAIDVWAVDFDDDGDIDVLSCGTQGHVVDLHLQNELGGFDRIVVTATFQNPRQVNVGDFDSDGDLDVVSCATYGSNQVRWWESTGGITPEFVEHPMTTSLNATYSVDVQDMDNDGDLDVIAAAVTTGRINWFENDGTGSFTERTVDSNRSSATNAVAADIDRDNRMDVVAVSLNNLEWYQNMGDGIFDEIMIDSSLPGARGVYVADLDDDGDLDVIGSSESSDDVIWWEQDGSPMPDIRVESPNGGEVWRVGTPHLITWISNTPDIPVLIELLTGAFVERVISNSTDNDGEYIWDLPGDLPLNSNYRIRITLIEGEGQDVSDSAFSVVALPTMTLTPVNEPIIIPPEGLGYWYYINLSNPSLFEISGQVWTEVIIPNGETFGPLSGYDVLIPAQGEFNPGFPYGQWVPPYAPVGTYHHVVKAGIFPTIVAITESFSFEKVAGEGMLTRPLTQWDIQDWHHDSDLFPDEKQLADQSDDSRPGDYVLHQVYPNPFNVSATVTVSLPEAGDLTITVFNTAGQQVLTLQRGIQLAGTHSFSFNANNLASGLYFVFAVVPEKLNRVQKVMLVK
jgi:FG-GAP-like repeat/Secretion system C-terminal sorting domain/Kre9/KNH-like N-terminal Ig-like domain